VSTITVACRTSLTYNPPRQRQRVDVYRQMKQPTTFSRGCVASSLSEDSGREPSARVNPQNIIPGSLQTTTQNISIL